MSHPISKGEASYCGVVEEYKLVVEEQGGFRRGRGCRDQIVSLILLGQTKVALQKDGFLPPLLILIRHIYDRVNREKLWGCLRGCGVKGKFLSMLQVLYLENSMEVKIGDKWSDCFPVSTGLPLYEKQ